MDFLAAAHDLQVAVGSGIRHEARGIDVALVRVVAGRPSLGGRLVGNVLLEQPLSRARGAVDVITTVGWNRRLARGLAVGGETVAEDLGGLWQPNEAEGSARLFFGPSLDFNTPAHDHVNDLRRATFPRLSRTPGHFSSRSVFHVNISTAHPVICR